jgi:hypothetical protein
MLETILTIIAWVAVAVFTIVFLFTLRSLYTILVFEKKNWPGPPDFDSKSTEYLMAKLKGTQYHPKPLFKGFVENVLGILGTLILLIAFIFVIIPQLSQVGIGKSIGFIIFLTLTILAGAFWIKPTLRSRRRFLEWLFKR